MIILRNIRDIFQYIFQNVIYSCDCKAEFLAGITPVSVSHDP